MVADYLEARRRVDGQGSGQPQQREQSDQPLVSGWVVVSTAVASLSHKQNPGTIRARVKRAKVHA